MTDVIDRARALQQEINDLGAGPPVQVPMGLSDLHFQSGPGPLGVWLYAAFKRLPRAKCSQCGNRRVLLVRPRRHPHGCHPRGRGADPMNVVLLTFVCLAIAGPVALRVVLPLFGVMAFVQ